MSQPFTQTQEQDICEAYQKGVSFPSLEAKHASVYEKISDVLVKNQIPRRKLGELRRTLVGHEKQIAETYLKGETIVALSVRYDVTACVIKRILRQEGVLLRTFSESHRQKSYDEEKIVFLYKSGVSQRSIAKTFELSTATIQRCLIRHGSLQKSPNRKGQKPFPISEEIFKEIIDVYVEKRWSIKQILSHFKLKTQHLTLSKQLRQRGVILRGHQQNRKYERDSNYFSNPHSPAKYWILGLIATDGYVNEVSNQLSIELNKEDVEALDFVKKELKYTGPFLRRKNSTRLVIVDPQMVKDLVGLGIHQNKSHTLQPMTWIKDDLFHHFLNGVISGDGWITFRRKHPNSNSLKSYIFQLGFCGSSEFITSVALKTEEKWKIKLCYWKTQNNFHRYYTSNRNTVLSICQIMFKDAPFVLKRKYEAYLQYVAYLNKKTVLA